MSSCWERIRSWCIDHPVLAPVIAGAIARMVAATVGLGFHARDDYFHILDPALRWVQDPSFDWDHSGLPGAGIRSHLFPRVVQGLLELFGALGVAEPDTMLRAIYATVGAYSLLVIPGAYFAARRLLGERGARLATWLAAAHFAMPYVGTRLLIEALAIPPLVWGIGFAASKRAREILLGGFLVGLACWFRFQTGVAGIGLAVAIAIIAAREGGMRAMLTRVGSLVAGGALAVAAQGLFDLWATGTFLGPVYANIMVNLCSTASGESSACAWVDAQGLDPHKTLSRSNPFAYLGIWLLLTAPPATIVLLPLLVRAAWRNPIVTWPWLLFVLVHSGIPHKEERFMLPVLPLFLILLAAVPELMEQARGPLWEKLRRWWPATRGWLVVTHLLALGLAVGSRSQANQREAMLRLRADVGARAVVSVGPEIHAYFLNRPEVPTYRRGSPDPEWLRDILALARKRGAPANRCLGFAPDREKIEAMLAAEGLMCDEPERLDGWWLDRLVYRLNPRRNRRRSPVLLWRCEQPALAESASSGQSRPEGG